MQLLVMAYRVVQCNERIYLRPEKYNLSRLRWQSVMVKRS